MQNLYPIVLSILISFCICMLLYILICEILQAEKFPVILEDTSFVRLWYKKDDEFLVPRARMIFDFVRYAISMIVRDTLYYKQIMMI